MVFWPKGECTLKNICLLILILIQSGVAYGCTFLTHASFSEATVSQPNIKPQSYADGIVFATSEVCVFVREAPPSARYRHLFVGPLIATIIPFEILTPDFPPEDREHFWIELVFEPKHEDLFLDLTQTTLVMRTGEKIAPSGFWTHLYFFSSPTGLTPPAAPIHLKYGRGDVRFTNHWIEEKPYITRVFLRFDKPSENSEFSTLRIDGLRNTGEAVSAPEITFRKVSRIRLSFPDGSSRDNFPVAPFDKGVCGID
jgi:hypothetical protein